MKRLQLLVLLGAGGGTRELISLMPPAQRRRVLGILDDNPALLGSSIQGARVLGPLKSAGKYPAAKFLSGIANSSNPSIRLKIAQEMDLPPERWASLVHPQAIVADDSSIGPGCIIYPGAVISTSARIGAHCVVYYHAVVHHDSQVGKGCCLCAGVKLAGFVTIGDGSYLGIGAAVRDHLTVGNGVLVGMGAMIVKNVPSNSRVAGVPARPMRKGRC